jgi:UDP-3-O-[3-hydroxymyristoyl] N-acetylglucosamine deacetylase/3-hydroxyacyl-[acyl-carrier-protein] dehydratase
MFLKQHTIRREISVEGNGLHTGEFARLTLRPAPENHGCVFKRVDVPEQPSIPALTDYVTDLERSTTLGLGNVKIHTVEHLLSALAGMQVDNVLIEINGPEVPILSGSAIEFINMIRKVGTEEQTANREFYVIDEPIHYTEPTKKIDLAALPFNEFRVIVLIDYNSKVLGAQHAMMAGLENYETEIGPSRTFCFLHEIETLWKSGLIKGGRLDNAIVIVDHEPSVEELSRLRKIFQREDIRVAEEGILNNIALHFANEPARHKLLDLIGDLALIGYPLKGQILAARPGHASNIAFARQISSLIKQKRKIRKFQQTQTPNVVFDIKAIQRILPHRYPFLLVDRITEFNENSIEGIKNVTINEPFFSGHFEGNPIMPGVLQLEAMAQVGGILLLNIVDKPEDVWVYLMAIDGVRFRKPVLPGDRIVYRIELLNMKRNICKMSGKAFVDDILVCEAEMVASLVKKEQ